MFDDDYDELEEYEEKMIWGLIEALAIASTEEISIFLLHQCALQLIVYAGCY